MKKIYICLAVVLTSASGFAISKVLATHSHENGKWSHGVFDAGHGGGLDKNGGHYDRQNGGYHFHR